MTDLTVAQLRAYQQICDPASGRMLVIAMDQRASMKNLIQVPAGTEATGADLLAAKLDLVRSSGQRGAGRAAGPEHGRAPGRRRGHPRP